MPNLLVTTTAAGGGCGGGMVRRTRWVVGGGPLSDFERHALLSSIDEEYYAKAVYQKVIDTFGFHRPFPRIRNKNNAILTCLRNLACKLWYRCSTRPMVRSYYMEFPTKQYACESRCASRIWNAATLCILLQGLTTVIYLDIYPCEDVLPVQPFTDVWVWAEYYESIRRIIFFCEVE